MSTTVDWNGHPPLRDARLRRVAHYAEDVCGLVVTSTTDGNHASTSYHYRRRAEDLGVRRVIPVLSKRKLKKAQVRILDHFGASYFTEFFGPINNLCARNGERTSISGALATQHDNHLHVAI